MRASTGMKPFLIGSDKLNTAAELGFYTSDPGNVVNNLILGKHGLGYRYWTELKSFAARPALVVVRKADAKLIYRAARNAGPVPTQAALR